MKPAPLRTVLIGCGQVAAGYGFDPQYTQFYRYPTHAEVLAEHPDFTWVAAVDPSLPARSALLERWPRIVVATSLKELPDSLLPFEAAIIATPPSARLSVLKELPASVKAILVEKPLGQTVAECQEFLERCRQRHIQLQVNLWRRGDGLHRELTGSGLQKRIGTLQGVSIVYGGGLHTTGTHLVDWLAMVAGTVKQVQAVPEPSDPTATDPSYSALITFSSGIQATLLALDWQHYRDLTIDLWGTMGRVTVGNEALTTNFWRVRDHRAMSGYKEIAVDQPGDALRPTVGEAFYHFYTNLAQATRKQAPLVATGEMALAAAQVIAAIETSARAGGTVIKL